MVDVVNEKIGKDFKNISLDEVILEVKKYNIKIEKFWIIGYIINVFYEELVESLFI